MLDLSPTHSQHWWLIHLVHPLKIRHACRETTSLKLAKMRGCTFVNQYVVIKYLGRGACGRVFLCMDMGDNRLYAVKVTTILYHPSSSTMPVLTVACSCTSV